MKMKQRGGGGDFKSPGGSTPDSPVGNTKKKRRTSNAGSGANSNSGASSPAVQSSQMPELIPPPPMSGFGDTIVASNPFDDSPQPRPGGPPPQQMPQMNMNCPPGPGPPMGPGGPGGPMHGSPMPPQQMPPGMGNHPGGGGPGPMMHGGSPQQMPPGMGGHPGGPMGGGPGPMMHGGPQQMSMGPMPGPGGPHNGPMGGPMNHNNNGMAPVGMGQTQWNGPPKPMPMQSGKIYPHDQPMVFNPQNPNAPPIYPCGVCHKEVHDNDQAIPCESGCNFWFHRVCTGLTEHAYHFLTQEVYAEWVCDKCLSTKNIPLVKFKP